MVKTELERAVRDNDLVYVMPIPSPTELASIVGAGMVKLATPNEVADPVAWLLNGGAGMGPLFSALVPYGVHLALSVSLAGDIHAADILGIYTDRKDTFVRELDSKREELDALAARHVVGLLSVPC